MDLQELHERTGISKRKLRYVLDHQLVPGLDIEIASSEVGRPRKFHEDVGFGIVCAARLLELGLPHEAIRYFLGALAQATVPVPHREPRELALAAILGNRWSAIAHLGDGINVRLVIEDIDFDSGWYAPGNPAKLATGYRPMVEVSLDLGQVLQQILGMTD